ncbi:uncharacterized protein LOC143509829 [Brachyhypopomus gauderio]|uniref:uncharacterized protein LOC143509829 n=1 Tax=Brachyhypopomus gauderio TaxID=698409 RepID=UPI0040424DC2
MEMDRKVSTRHMRRYSYGVLQDLVNKRFNTEGKDAYTRSPVPKKAEGTHTSAYLHPLTTRSFITRRGSLVLTNRPSAVDVYQLNRARPPVNGAVLSDMYLPAITGKTSNLQAARLNLNHSCPYLYTSRRRGSASSVVSNRASDVGAKQRHLKEQKDLKKSNVLVTMTYLGHGKRSTQDEMRVLQQICGGESICVFKGHVQPGEQFQFTSQRHVGYPFSATFYVNGIMAGRISSCCEYRYTPGFQQGRKSCFQLSRLNGGKPCYKCVSSRQGIGQEATELKQNNPQTVQSNEGVPESHPSSPLFIPLGMEKFVRRTRRIRKESSAVSTDSEDTISPVKERKLQKRYRRERGSQQDHSKHYSKSHSKDHSKSHSKDHSKDHSKGSEESRGKRDTGNDVKPPSSNHARTPLEKQETIKKQSKETPGTDKTRVPDSLQDRESLSKQNGKKKPDHLESNGKIRIPERRRDFYEECVEMSAGLESGLDQQKWFKASKYERNKIKEQITLGPHLNDSASEVELSEESDSSVLQSKRGNTKQVGTLSQDTLEYNGSEKTQELQKKLDAITEVLSTSDEVEQLVLRNTGITDELLKSLVAALKNSLSEVTMINLNLNHIGPPGVQDLLDLLEAKLAVKGLLLFGNQLGDTGVQILLNGVAELQTKTASPRVPGQFYLSAPSFTLIELDLGGNGISSEGLRVLGTYMKYHSHLQYLGLAQTSCSDMEAWTVLFESLKVNNNVTHIILDENNLGDQGVKLCAEALRVNESLRKVELDSNGFGEAGASAVLEALLSRRFLLEHLSLEDNYISTALMSKIQQAIKPNSEAS